MTPARKRWQDGYQDKRPGPEGFRTVIPGQTLSQLLEEEMLLRGHRPVDAAREMGTSTANVARWCSIADPSIPGKKNREQRDNVARITRYLRLPDEQHYALVAYSSEDAKADLRRRASRSQ